MGKRPRVYGDEKRFKATLGRHITRGRDLLDQVEGVRNVMASAPGGVRGLVALLTQPGLKPRHARLAVDGAETAIRFIVTTMDDLALLPP